MRNTLYTVGYEKRSVEQFFDLLQENGIELLLDIRIRAQSRKKGFSKSHLELESTKRGITYMHFRSLGTPEHIMKHLKETGTYDWDAYRMVLADEGAVLCQVADMCLAKRACLLCYELDANICHRKIVADELATRTNMAVRHL